MSSDRMPSYSVENGREAVRKNEKGWYVVLAMAN
jgi:hypothetical protein